MASVSITALLLLLLVVDAESIICAERDAVCKVNPVAGHPWSTDGQRPAPVPQDLSYKFYESGEPSSFINISWTQKGSDMEHVEGYYIEITSPYIANALRYTVTWKKTVLQKFYKNTDQNVTFSFDDVLCVPMELYVKVYALPSYQNDTSDYHQSIIIDTRKCNLPEEDLPDYPISGEYMDDYYDHQETSTTQVSGERRFKSIPYNYDHQETSTTKASGTSIVTSQPGISLPYTMLACALTAIATVLIFGIIVLVYKICTKKTHIKGRVSHDEKNQASPGKGDGKAKVLIVATMGDDEHDGACDSYFKKMALCLKSVLEESKEFDVSCNLLTANELSEKGVAIWAHELVKSHDKIVALCSPSITENIDYVHGYTLHPGKVYTDASLQILQSFVLNHHLNETELIFACLDEPLRHCASESLLGLKNCKHINLVYEFPKFIDSLSKNESYVPGQKIAAMWSDFRLMREKNNVQKPMAPPPVTTAALKISSETQYDSVYSSRCNSHSTESISSHEDTGFHEGNHDKLLSMEQYTFMGARPKMSA